MRQLACIGLVALLGVAVCAAPVVAAPLLRVQGVFVTLTFEACQSVHTVRVYNGGDGVLEWTITSDRTWLTVSPDSGLNAPGIENGTDLTITVDRTGLGDGLHEGQLRITSNGGSKTIRVRMFVQDAPKAGVSPATLNFSLERPSKSFRLKNEGAETLDYTLSATQPWIVITAPLTGSLECTASVTIPVQLDPASLPNPDMEQSGQIIVTTNGIDALVDVVYLPAAQAAGVIGVYSDQLGTDCNIPYTVPTLLPVYIVHTKTAGATACQLAAPQPDCWTNAIWLSDTPIYAITIGTSQTGFAMGYGACLDGPILVLTVNYFVQFPPDQMCCPYPTLPDPNVPSGEIEVVDCNNNLVFGQGAVAVVNPDETCPCGDGPIRVEETTWGRIKAMYAPPTDPPRD